ncbi:MAG: flagellar basal body rod protein FlgB [Gammaproteobacteria bacterium]|nr:MAG: flagellar basal body rod protein FlgB [Gammaproteobacteria bacterium]
MSISIDKHLGTHANAVMLRGKRAEILANNLANADTPGFKAQDLDFRQVLAGVGSTDRVVLDTRNAGHIAASDDTGSGQLRYRVPAQASLDGNTVEKEAENARFADNAIRYQASLEFLGRRIGGLIRTLRDE